MAEHLEFRVRPVTRYIVTRFKQEVFEGVHVSASSKDCQQKGEFDNYETAYAVAYALAKEEHGRLGYPPGDERIKYPSPTAQERPLGDILGEALQAARQ